MQRKRFFVLRQFSPQCWCNQTSIRVLEFPEAPISERRISIYPSLLNIKASRRFHYEIMTNLHHWIAWNHVQYISQNQHTFSLVITYVNHPRILLGHLIRCFVHHIATSVAANAQWKLQRYNFYIQLPGHHQRMIVNHWISRDFQIDQLGSRLGVVLWKTIFSC